MHIVVDTTSPVRRISTIVSGAMQESAAGIKGKRQGAGQIA